mmetsp:Transcript_16812/g.46340  ORF Transcript_16812/g.46340 Transcript_16812/m.46340 type:complete len:279 (+) Transcript_16812:569-1405(+)
MHMMQPPPATTPLLPQIAHGPVRVPSQALALLQLQPARSQSRVVGPLSRGRAGPAAPQVVRARQQHLARELLPALGALGDPRGAAQVLVAAAAVAARGVKSKRSRKIRRRLGSWRCSSRQRRKRRRNRCCCCYCSRRRRRRRAVKKRRRRAMRGRLCLCLWDTTSGRLGSCTCVRLRLRASMRGEAQALGRVLMGQVAWRTRVPKRRARKGCWLKRGVVARQPSGSCARPSRPARSCMQLGRKLMAGRQRANTSSSSSSSKVERTQHCMQPPQQSDQL